MNGNVVVLILGVFALAFLAFLTHTLVRARSTRTADRPSTVAVRVGVRAQVAEEVRAASERRGLSRFQVSADADRAVDALTSTSTVRPGRCLWVDRDPDAIVHERRMVELLHVDIDTARTTNQALQFMAGRRYDFLVTDLTRPVATGGMDDRAGIKLLKMLAGAPAVPPVIVYADAVDNGDDGVADAAEPASTTAAATTAPTTTAAAAATTTTSATTSAADDEAAAADDADDETDDDAGTDGDERSEAVLGPEDFSGPIAVTPGVADGTVPAVIPEVKPADPRLDDARAAGARAAVTTPADLLAAVLGVVDGT